MIVKAEKPGLELELIRLFSPENPFPSGAGLAAQLPAAPTRTAPGWSLGPSPRLCPCLVVCGWARAFLVPPVVVYHCSQRCLLRPIPVSSPAWHSVHSAAPFCSLIVVASPEGVQAHVRASRDSQTEAPWAQAHPRPSQSCAVCSPRPGGQGHRPARERL